MLSTSSGSKRAQALDSITPPSSKSKVKKAQAFTSSPLLAFNEAAHVSSPTHPQDLVSPSGVASKDVALPSSGLITPTIDTIQEEPSLVARGSSLPSAPSCSGVSLARALLELSSSVSVPMTGPCTPLSLSKGSS